MPPRFLSVLCHAGGGSGGVRASRMSSAAGAKVGLVELPYNAVSSATQGGLGGTCVIRGCVPKKLLVFGAQFEAEFRDARGFGWDHGESMPSFSWEKLISAKTDEIERLNGIYGRILDNNGVEKFEGAGKVTGPHSVEVTAYQADPRSVYLSPCISYISLYISTHLTHISRHALWLTRLTNAGHMWCTRAFYCE